MKKKVILLSFIILFGFATSICTAKYSGGNGEPNNPYRISTPYDMNDIGLHDEDRASHFVLTNDINLAQFTGTQFNIIGKWVDWGHPDNKPFTGIFDGNGFTISNFTYNSTGTDRIGLFGFVGSRFDPNSEIRNLGLIDPDVNAGTVLFTARYVGSLVGWLGYGIINNCYVQGGSISGAHTTGGLAGENHEGTISNCYATIDVVGNQAVGGLVGCAYNSRGTISNCYATGSISGDHLTGGLVGWGSNISNCYATGAVNGNDYNYTGGLVGWGGYISKSYATGNVNGNNFTGGLVGCLQSGRPVPTSNCYATGDVNGNDYTGGLAGAFWFFRSGGHASNCYATGNVNGSDCTGGLVGWSGYISNSYAIGDVNGNECAGGLAGSNFFCSTISNCYSSGDVTGDDPNTGGLVGYDFNFQTFYTKCFWDRDINPGLNGIGNLTDPNVIGETTENMQTESTFTSAGWDFVGETDNGSDDIWKMCYDPDYPHLWWEQCPRPSLEMPMHFTPRKLNPKSKGKWIKAHFILPEGFAVGDVNINSPARIVEPFMADSNYMDVFLNEDDLVEIEAAFDRAVFCSNGSAHGDIVVIAQLTTGQYFYGTDTIRIKTNNLEYLAVLTSHWLRTDCKKPHWCEDSDINQDGTVDFIDFALFDGCCLEFIKN